jgi:[pyruvate, water dikinase]-phosphate phosphotransferase / [pyruvate, water dikinase] kinase
MTPRRQPNPFTIYAVSDATGATAESVALAALVQFRSPQVAVQRRGQVRTIRQVRAVVEQAAQSDGALILYTLVSAELRRAMIAAARRHGVEAVDLLGPVLGRLMGRLQQEPLRRPGAFKHLVRAHPREIEAVEFAVRHDDGRLPEGLDEAEIALVGVSRTMKTPTTLYLAYRGWLVANVPIHPDLPLPQALLALPPERVFCLLMAPARLQEIRASRAKAMNMPLEPYASLEHIRRELLHTEQLSLDHGWRQIDVSGKSVEEVAREIVHLHEPGGPTRKPAR